MSVTLEDAEDVPSFDMDDTTAHNARTQQRAAAPAFAAPTVTPRVAATHAAPRAQAWDTAPPLGIMQAAPSTAPPLARPLPASSQTASTTSAPAVPAPAGATDNKRHVAPAGAGTQIEQYLAARIMEWVCQRNVTQAVHDLNKLMDKAPVYALFVARRLVFLDLDIGFDTRRTVLVPRLLLAADCDLWFPVTASEGVNRTRRKVEFVLAAVARWYAAPEEFQPVLSQAVLDARDTAGAVSWVWIEFAARWRRDHGVAPIPFIDAEGDAALARRDIINLLLAMRQVERLGIHADASMYDLLKQDLRQMYDAAPMELAASSSESESSEANVQCEAQAVQAPHNAHETSSSSSLCNP